MVFDGLPILVALADAAILFATAVALAYGLKAMDPDSIISLRRTFGLLLVPNSIWAILVAVGALFSSVAGNPRLGLNEFVLGAFFAWSFQFIIVNGAFTTSTPRSICIGAVQPMAVLLLTWAFVAHHGSNIIYSSALGFLTLAIATVFLLKFKTFKTEGAGVNALQTFQSFLKSWVSQKPADLEGYFKLYSHDEPVTTKVILLNTADRVALVLPGVHPGPFFPVGSYNLSELIYRELRKNKTIPMVLHGTGGHERNLPTNETTKGYAAAIAAIVISADGKRTVKTMRGPVVSNLGPTRITMMGFGTQVVAFLTNAPYNTDDLEPSIIDEALEVADEMGVDFMLVDAHNSIGGQNIEQPRITKDDWKHALSAIRDSAERDFEVGMAHSSEIAFQHGSDISDGGLGLLVFRKEGSTYAVVASDSNNAAIGLRQGIIDELKKDNVELIELCTSDTHNSAARKLTDRGYRALGEDTSQGAIAAVVGELEKLAAKRLSKATVTPISSQMTLPLIGEKSLDDFAKLTLETLDFTKAYTRVAVVAAFVIFTLALLY